MTSYSKQYLIMPSVEAGRMYLSDYIVNHGGNYARWFSTNPDFQKAYREHLSKINPRIYQGPQKKGRGRKRSNGGKVNVRHIDKRRWKRCYEDDHIEAFELVVKCVSLKRNVKVVYLKQRKGSGYTILLSTDLDLKGETIISYYNLRFQIEFLIRDAKQYMGLEECQAISETKLYNHFNLSLMTVSLMKYTCWASLPNKKQVPFSMRSIRTCFCNKYLTEFIFSNLGLELKSNKIRRLYSKYLNIGSMAA